MTSWSDCLELYDKKKNKVPGIMDQVSLVNEVDFRDVRNRWELPGWTEEVKKVKSILSDAEPFERVFLSHCNLGEHQIRTLCDIFKNVKVTKLDLAQNPNINAKGWRLVGELVKQSKITSLCAWWCELDTDKLTKFIDGAEDAKLDELSIVFNPTIDADGWLRLGKFIASCGLKILYAAYCDLTAECLDKFVQGIGDSKIQYLNIGYNYNISAEGWELIGTLVKKSEITSLGIDHCGLDTNRLIKFIEALAGAKIDRLVITANKNIDADGWLRLGKFIASCGLKSLDAEGCEPTAKCLDDFVQGLGNSKLEVLNLNGIQYVDELLAVLPHVNGKFQAVDSIFNNESLIKLRVKLRIDNLTNLSVVVQNSAGETVTLTHSWEPPADWTQEYTPRVFSSFSEALSGANIISAIRSGTAAGRDINNTYIIHVGQLITFILTVLVIFIAMYWAVYIA